MKLAIRMFVVLLLATVAIQTKAQTIIVTSAVGTTINAKACWNGQCGGGYPQAATSSGTIDVGFDVLITSMSVCLNDWNMKDNTAGAYGWFNSPWKTGYSVTGPNGATVVLMPVEWCSRYSWFTSALTNFEFVEPGSGSLQNNSSYYQGTQGIMLNDDSQYGYGGSNMKNVSFYSYQSFAPFFNASSQGSWKLNVTATDADQGSPANVWAGQYGQPVSVDVNKWSVGFVGTYATASAAPLTLFTTATLDIGVSTTTGGTITVSNTGGRPLDVTAVIPISGFTDDYTVVGDLPTGIAGVSPPSPPASGLVTFQFKAGGIGPRIAVFKIVTSGLDVSTSPPSAQSFTVTMLGSGSGQLMIATFNNTLFRQQVLTGDVVTKYFKIANPGNKFLTISKTIGGVTTGGLYLQDFIDPNGKTTDAGPTNYNDYKILYPAGTLYNGQPFVLAPGAIDSVGIQFSPKRQGARITNLYLQSDAVNAVSVYGTSSNFWTFMLQGVGITPRVTVTSGDFGYVNQGDTVLSEIKIHNTGDGNLNFKRQEIVEGDPKQFRIVTPFPSPIRPDSTRSMWVAFNPESLDFQACVVGLTTNCIDQDSNIRISMQGWGIAVAHGKFAPTELFKKDTGEVGGTPTPRTFTITNTGSGPLNVTNIVFTGRDSGNYYVVSPKPPFTVGQSPAPPVVVTLGFRPQKGHGGSSQATAIVYSNNAGGGANNIILLGYSCERTSNAVPESLFVGIVIDTSSSKQDAVVLSNPGNCPVSLTKIELTGPDANLYKLIPPLPTSIAPNGNVTVTLEFKSPRVNTQTPIAALRVTTDSKTDSVLTLPLLARGCFFNITSVPAKGSVLFDNDASAVGDTTHQGVVIQNTGCVPLQITSVTVQGADPTEFPQALIKYPAGFIQPGAIDSVVFTFARLTNGTKSAAGVISTNSPETPQIAYCLGSASTACIVDVQENRHSGIEVVSYDLRQNYPNPFNPTTNLTFDVANYGVVKLDILNTLGEVVARLENKFLQPGRYSSTFDATSLPSGTYYARLTAGTYKQTRVMILIK